MPPDLWGWTCIRCRIEPYAGTGLYYSSSSGICDRTSCRPRGDRRARSRQRDADARADRALAARADPLGATACRHPRPVDSRAGRDPRRLAGSRDRGLRPARGRGLPDHAPGCSGARRERRARSRSAHLRSRCWSVSPTTSIPAYPTLRAFPASHGCARCARRCATRRSMRSATAIHAGCRACAKRSAEYLGRVRGCDADPEHVVVCTGFMQGFSLLCRALQSRGVEQIALEDPGWHVHRLIVEQAGLEVVPIPVDASGISVDALARTDVAAVSSPRPISSPRAPC